MCGTEQYSVKRSHGNCKIARPFSVLIGAGTAQFLHWCLSKPVKKLEPVSISS